MKKTAVPKTGASILAFKRLCCLIALLAIASLCPDVEAQVYPDTLWVPVTFYDFHSDRSNPEFEARHNPLQKGRPSTGMVQNRLGPDKKPVLGPNPNMNRYIKYWFRPWEDFAKGDSTIPLYDPRAGYKERQAGDWPWEQPGVTFLKIDTIDTDTSFINVVIEDSLAFIHQGSGLYQFIDLNFFPLDDRGFGNEWNFADGENSSQNFSFTMELHWKFTKMPGLTFDFLGDDDVWAFINDSLVMDLGGVHEAEGGFFNIDDIDGLVDGQEYDFDLFYAERHSSASTIIITTNIVSTGLAMLELHAEPNDTVHVGDTVTAWAVTVDENDSIRSGYGDYIRWQFLDDNGRGYSDTTLFSANRSSPPTGDTVFFAPTKAYQTVRIEGFLIDTVTQDFLRDTLTIYVLPGPPHHLVIEGDSIPDLHDDQPIEQITIGSDEIRSNAFAILRDKHGNFVRHSQQTSWDIVANPEALDSVVNGDENVGEGVAYKQGDPGIARISATDLDTSGLPFSDTIDVVINETSYDSLRILGEYNNRIIPIDSLTIDAHQCKLLSVEGRRVDRLGWDPVAGAWFTDLPTLTAPPQSNSSFSFCPTDTGTGIIRVSYSTAPSSSIPVRVNYGGPYSIDLYDFPGDPAEKTPLDDPIFSYSVMAGDTFDVYAKLFNKNGYWLSEYETDSASIKWTVVELSNDNRSTGILTKSSGAVTGFSPRIAQRSVYVIGTWGDEDNLLMDTVRIKSVPGVPHYLSIQASPDPNGTDLSGITFTPTDTVKNAYAVIRDRFDNFVEVAYHARWFSLDTSIVSARVSGAGEGQMYRRTDSTSQVEVVALDTTDNRNFSDTLIVDISQITFTDIEISVYESRYENIDTLNIRTDQDTMVYSRGKRSDNGKWVNLASDWQLLGQITTRTAPPHAADKWKFEPLTVAPGRIIATGPDNIADTVFVQTGHGLAHHLALYRDAEDPVAGAVFPGPNHPDTIQAGSPLELVANVFDLRNAWLEKYRSAPDENKISWQIVEQTGNASTGSLSNTKGSITTFIPTVAYRSVMLVASLHENDNYYRDSTRVYIAPGEADHLVIEPSSNPRSTSPNRDNPAKLITLSPKDTTESAYAVLRDMYGNFVGFSEKTDWFSLDDEIVKAAEGFERYGEGRIVRVAHEGNTFVVARNRINPQLFDSVEVELNRISYDSLRIVENAGQRIESISVKTGYTTTIYAEGLRSDGRGWEQIPVDWHKSPALRVKHNPPSQSADWEVAPAEEGNGIIWITKGSSPADTIDAVFQPGDPSNVTLYEKPGAPDNGNPPLPEPTSPIVVSAGVAVELAAKVFDKNGYWLDQYEDSDSASLITWKIVEQGNSRATGTLSNTDGHVNTFSPRTAFQTAFIIASYDQVYSDTVAVTVKAGPPHHIVLEGSQDKNVSPNDDNPIDTIEITEIDTLKRVYAIIRDEFENFVQHSFITDWRSGNTELVTAEDGDRNIGEGFVNRVGTEGFSFVAATSMNGFDLQKESDSVVVKVSPYYYTELRIVDSLGNVLEELELTTNDYATLLVEGRRSDNPEIWEPIAGEWSKLDSLVITPAPPENSQQWTFSPDKPATGWISVGLDNETTVSDTLPVTFKRGKPTSVEFDLLTPSDKLIAGDTIVTVVRIKNDNGLVPGSWCYPGAGENQTEYSDTLNNGDRRDAPIIIIDGESGSLENGGVQMDQCFDGGIDTVRFVLYHAPASKDSMHLLTVELDGIQARTPPFNLKPGKIAALKLVENNAEKTEIPDSLTLRFPSGSVTMISVGYDAYDNLIGPVKSDWRTTGSLHEINYPENTQQIYYTSADATNSESGFIFAAVNDTISDSAHVRIAGPAAQLVEAFTRDTSGNGYLDAIDIHFDRKVVLPKSFFDESISSHFVIASHSTEFIVIGIEGAQEGDSITSARLILEETTSNEKPQTGWEPELFFLHAGGDIEDIDEAPLTVKDGAAPVIWSVTRKVNDADNRASDKITVVFSEDVFTPEGIPLSLTNPPENLFNVWSDSTGSQVLKPDILKGISSFSEGTQGNTAVFYMTNEKEITGNHFFSLKPEGEIADELGSTPNENNQHVRVVVIGNLGSIRIGPNPLRPVFYKHDDPLLARDHDQALGWARNKGGAIFVADFVIPGQLGQGGNSGGSTGGTINKNDISASMTIYDGIGNLVYKRKGGKDFLREVKVDEWVPGTSQQLTIYWSGITDAGRAAAPGIYRVIMLLEVSDNQVKLNGNIGVGR